MTPSKIIRVEQEGEDGVLVTFSDNTVAGYVIEELLELRPLRERTKKRALKSPAPQNATKPLTVG